MNDSNRRPIPAHRSLPARWMRLEIRCGLGLLVAFGLFVFLEAVMRFDLSFILLGCAVMGAGFVLLRS